MAVRRLWAADAPLLKDLLRLRSSLGVSRLSPEELVSIEARIELGLLNINCVWWGNTHPDGALRCALLQVLDARWPDTWNAALLLTDGSTPSWNYRLNGLDDAWRVAFSWGRTKGRQKVVWSLPTAWARTKRLTGKRTDVWLDYDIEDLKVVGANQLPEDEFERWIYGETVKPYPVLLRRAVRRQLSHLEAAAPPQA